MRTLYSVLMLSLTALLIVAWLCVCAQPAYAYVDPGAGIFALQVVSSTVAGMIFLLRKHLRSLLKRLPCAPHSEGQKDSKL